MELPERTRNQIDRGEKIGTIFNQDAAAVLPRGLQLILLGLLLSGFWDGKGVGLVKVDVIKLIAKHQRGQFKQLEEQIEKVKSSDELTSLVKSSTKDILEALYV